MLGKECHACSYCKCLPKYCCPRAVRRYRATQTRAAFKRKWFEEVFTQRIRTLLDRFSALARLPLAIVLVLVFFVTSSDSGSLVIDGITAGGKTDAPMSQRIFWAVLEGIIAVALLVGGGSEALTAIQAAAITIGLPFTLLLLVMCVSLFKGLKSDLKFVK